MNDAIKENIKFNTEKLKIVSTVVILLTGGLIGLLFKDTEDLAKRILFVAGAIAFFIAAIYLWRLNNIIKKLLSSLEVKNV